MQSQNHSQKGVSNSSQNKVKTLNMSIWRAMKDEKHHQKYILKFPSPTHLFRILLCIWNPSTQLLHTSQWSICLGIFIRQSKQISFSGTILLNFLSSTRYKVFLMMLSSSSIVHFQISPGSTFCKRMNMKMLIPNPICRIRERGENSINFESLGQNE